MTNQNTKTCSSCHHPFVWSAACLVGYMHDEPAPLELRNCPYCGTTLSERTSWAHLEQVVRQISVAGQRSAALAIVDRARELEREKLKPGPVLAVSVDRESGRFFCEHGHTLDERCDGCDADAERARAQVTGKHAAGAGGKR